MMNKTTKVLSTVKKRMVILICYGALFSYFAYNNTYHVLLQEFSPCTTSMHVATQEKPWARPFLIDYPSTKAPTPKIDNRIIFFMHIHKAGGTTMCKMAQKYGMSTNPLRNCNVQPDYACCGGVDTLSAQKLFAENTTFSFVACESFMYRAVYPDGYYYVITLRDPLARYISHYHQYVKMIHNRRPELVTCLPDMNVWLKHQPDNFIVRHLCGFECKNTMKFQISRKQLQSALSQLHVFESILFMETFTTDFQSFAETVGWWDPSKSKVRWWWGPSESKATPLRVFNGGHYDTTNLLDIDPFMTVLDDALYEYAKQLVANRVSGGSSRKGGLLLQAETKARIDTYFEEGPSRGSITPNAAVCAQNTSNTLHK